MPLERRLANLRYANHVRVHRAELKRRIAARDLAATDVLLGVDTLVETWKVRQLLLAVPGLGVSKVDAALRSCRVSHSKTCGGLSTRQRGELLAYLDGR
jgi:hypothetical protein